jgi:hypothetical protein
VQEHLDLGLAGRTAIVGPDSIQIRLAGIGSGTNTPGASYLDDWSAILLPPVFAAGSPAHTLAQSFELALIPDTWRGLPGQHLSLSVSFNEVLNRPLTGITHTVTSGAPGQIGAGVCLGAFGYVFGCTGEEHAAVATGSSAGLVVTGHAPVTPFAVSGSFSGELPDGSFDRLTLTTEITVVPEPSTFLPLCAAGTAIAWKRSRLRST